MLDVPVLISGGGPVGLAASLFLSQHGVRSLMVERHPSTALTPKARGINARTMEVFRQCGIDDSRPRGRARGRRHRPDRLDGNTRGPRDRAPRAWPCDCQEHGGDAGQELPLRAGRSRAGHSPPCGGRWPRRAALQHRDDVVHSEGRCRHRHPDRSCHRRGNAVHRALFDRGRGRTEPRAACA